MVYAAQEYGERGMEAEGFSGLDGRTTIFDYWSIDTLCRAANGQLTPQEQQLAADYRSILAIARSEKAIDEGAMFDLMYVNKHLSRQYAFIRKSATDTLLVVVNFDDAEAHVSLTIPAHAFDYMAMREADAEATDLLSGQTVVLPLQRDGQLQFTVPSRYGLVLKIGR
jgi:hypothetical protein